MVPLPNAQPPEKPDLHDDGSVEVHSVFATIQGEGPFQGVPAVFLRLAGCNLQCPGCDTEYTKTRVRSTPEQVLNTVRAVAARAGLSTYVVVVTGGEPFRQDIGPVVQELLHAEMAIQIETNGTLKPTRSFPYYAPDLTIVCSPKTPRVVSQLDLPRTYWKYVIEHDKVDPTDGLPTSVLENGLRPYRSATAAADRLLVMPYDDGSGFNSPTNILNRRAAVASAMRFGYRVQVQSHKLFELP